MEGTQQRIEDWILDHSIQPYWRDVNETLILYNPCVYFLRRDTIRKEA